MFDWVKEQRVLKMEQEAELKVLNENKIAFLKYILETYKWVEYHDSIYQR